MNLFIFLILISILIDHLRFHLDPHSQLDLHPPSLFWNVNIHKFWPIHRRIISIYAIKFKILNTYRTYCVRLSINYFQIWKRHYITDSIVYLSFGIFCIEYLILVSSFTFTIVVMSYVELVISNKVTVTLNTSFPIPVSVAILSSWITFGKIMANTRRTIMIHKQLNCMI